MAPAEPPVAPTERAEFALALRLHNEGEFYEAHEAWEQIWIDELDDEWRLFVQGLIQVTSAFHKLFVQREPRGAARLLERGLKSSISTHLTTRHALGLFRDLAPRPASGAWLTSSRKARRSTSLTAPRPALAPPPELKTGPTKTEPPRRLIFAFVKRRRRARAKASRSVRSARSVTAMSS